MTYGFCPDDWPRFHAQITRRGIELAEIERIELRDTALRCLAVTVVLRSGRVESWVQAVDARPSFRPSRVAIPDDPGR